MLQKSQELQDLSSKTQEQKVDVATNLPLVAPTPKSQIEQLPLDVLVYMILMKTALRDRMRFAQCSKQLLAIADSSDMWKIECLKAGIPLKANEDNYKNIYKNAISADSSHLYYVVGSQIKSDQPSSLLDKGFPYPKARTKIPANEILDSFPVAGKVHVFSTVEDARKFARSKMEWSDHSTVEYSSAIFEVSINQVPMTTKSLEIKEDTHFLLPTMKKKAAEKVPYFDIDIKDITAVHSASMAYNRHVTVNFQKENTKNCVIS